MNDRYAYCLTLEERRNRQDLTEIFQMYKGFTKMDISELFTKDSNVKGTRGHTLKFKKPGCAIA